MLSQPLLERPGVDQRSLSDVQHSQKCVRSEEALKLFSRLDEFKEYMERVSSITGKFLRTDQTLHYMSKGGVRGYGKSTPFEKCFSAKLNVYQRRTP